MFESFRGHCSAIQKISTSARIIAQAPNRIFAINQNDLLKKVKL